MGSSKSLIHSREGLGSSIRVEITLMVLFWMFLESNKKELPTSTKLSTIRSENKSIITNLGESEMSLNLTEASQQWATRPADERFWGLTDLLEALQNQK